MINILKKLGEQAGESALLRGTHKRLTKFKKKLKKAKDPDDKLYYQAQIKRLRAALKNDGKKKK